MNIIHIALIVTVVQFVIIRETLVAPLPKTTQELVGCVAGFVEAIHTPSSTRDLVFTLVASMLDTLPLLWKWVFLLQPVFLPQEPFHGGLGVVGVESPSLHRLGGDGVFLHAVEAIVMQTSSRDRHFVKGTKAGLFTELMTKGQTSLSEEFYIGDTIVHEMIPLHVKLCLVGHLSNVPSLELSLARRGHGFSRVVFFSQAWDPRSRRSQGC